MTPRDRVFGPNGLRVLKSPYRSPLANCICERVIGTLRRECLDFLIPLTELHLLRVVRKWARYYNTARPHMSLGPGIPSPFPHARCWAGYTTTISLQRSPHDCERILRITLHPDQLRNRTGYGDSPERPHRSSGKHHDPGSAVQSPVHSPRRPAWRTAITQIEFPAQSVSGQNRLLPP